MLEFYCCLQVSCTTVNAINVQYVRFVSYICVCVFDTHNPRGVSRARAAYCMRPRNLPAKAKCNLTPAPLLIELDNYYTVVDGAAGVHQQRRYPSITHLPGGQQGLP